MVLVRGIHAVLGIVICGVFEMSFKHYRNSFRKDVLERKCISLQRFWKEFSDVFGFMVDQETRVSCCQD